MGCCGVCYGAEVWDGCGAEFAMGWDNRSGYGAAYRAGFGAAVGLRIGLTMRLDMGLLWGCL